MTISRKLLSFSRLDDAQPETFEVSAALQDLRPMLRQLLGSEIDLLLEHPQAALAVHMDRSHFELMILNIAGNAKDAVGGEGTFRISAAQADADQTIELTLSDDGTGAPESVRARAFEHFFTTKTKRARHRSRPAGRARHRAGSRRRDPGRMSPQGETSVYIVLPVLSSTRG